MKNEWILDVLADLKGFAQQNGMTMLAEQLDDAQIVAAAELALSGEGKREHDGYTATAAGPPVERVGRRI